MTTYTVDTPDEAPYAVVEARTPRAALAAMLQMIGQCDPSAGEYLETTRNGGWAYRIGQDDRLGIVGGFAYFALPAA